MSESAEISRDKIYETRNKQEKAKAPGICQKSALSEK
jgi:hypothetical protein